MKNRFGAFITKNILLLSFVSFLTDVASEMLYPIMPLYLQALGITALGIGLIEGVAELTAGISKSLFGYLGDALRKPEWFVRIGYGLSAFTKPLMGLFTSAAAIVGLRTADRLGKGIRTSSRDAILAQDSDKKDRGKVFGFHRSLDTLGAALGPIITLVLLAGFSLYNSLNTIFLITAIPGVLAVLLTFMVSSKNITRKLTKRSKPQAKSIKAWLKTFDVRTYSSPFRKLLLGYILVALLNSSDVFLLLRVKELMGDQANIFGFVINSELVVIGVYILYNLFYAMLSIVMGWYADARSYKTTYITGLLAFMVAYGLLSRSMGLEIIVLAFIIYAVFAAANDAVSKAWLSKNLQDYEQGTGTGVASTFISIAFFVSSLMTGLIWVRLGSSAALAVISLGAITPIIYFVLQSFADKKVAT